MLLIAIVRGGCNESTTPIAGNPADSSTAGTKQYRRMEGTIANQPVVLQLQQTQSGYQAMYYYRSVGQWLMLYLDSMGKDSLYFSEHQHSDNWTGVRNARWQCALMDDTLKCYWISADAKKSLPFSLYEHYPEGAYRFSVHYLQDSTIAYPNSRRSPVAKLSYTYVTALNNPRLNAQIKSIFSFDTLASVEESFGKASADYAKRYRQQLPAEDDFTLSSFSFNHEEAHSTYIRYNDRDLVVIEHTYYENTGGAHGNYGSHFYCYDLRLQKQLSLSDLVTADSTALQTIVEAQFRKQYRIRQASLESILFDTHLALTHNFYLTEKGIGFMYQPYEVAAYVMGQINVFVPFDQLQPYLTPYAQQRFGLQ